MGELRNIAKEAGSIIITGHKRPDGDCIGACIATYHYLKGIYPEKNIKVYLENMPSRFAFLDPGMEIVSTELPSGQFDLFMSFDCSAPDMLGMAGSLFSSSKATVCIDHHISNKGSPVYIIPERYSFIHKVSSYFHCFLRCIGITEYACIKCNTCIKRLCCILAYASFIHKPIQHLACGTC